MTSWYLSEEGISLFRPKLTNKTEKAFRTPPPRVVEGWNLYVWQWIFEAHLMVTSKHSQVLQNRHLADHFWGGWRKSFSDDNCWRNFVFCVEKWNVGDHLKRVFPKFEAERSHPRGVNGRSKFWKKLIFFQRFRRQNMKCWGSSETRFGQVPGQSEPSSGGKRTFKVRKNFDKIFIEKWNVGDRLKRVLAKFRADRSQVRGVNGRSKFVGDDVGPFSVPYKV